LAEQEATFLADTNMRATMAKQIEAAAIAKAKADVKKKEDTDIAAAKAATQAFFNSSKAAIDATMVAWRTKQREIEERAARRAEARAKAVEADRVAMAVLKEQRAALAANAQEMSAKAAAAAERSIKVADKGVVGTQGSRSCPLQSQGAV
jgi:hypothetical protein